jgi:hypothetical protein
MSQIAHVNGAARLGDGCLVLVVAQHSASDQQWERNQTLIKNINDCILMCVICVLSLVISLEK